MRFSYNWLKHYLRMDLTPHQVAQKLTSIGHEVESFEDPEEIFKGFFVAQIESAEKHPNADRLKVCSVLSGNGKKYHVVCGAPNARAGLKTILAIPGTRIPKTGDVLKKSKIRGEVSEGMMCSESELGISESSHGIIELPENTDLSACVGDLLGYDGGIYDVSITPNRGDCLSVKGIARELAAAGAGSFINSDLSPENISLQGSFEFPLNINKVYGVAAAMPCGTFRVIRGVKNGESPDWLKKYLKIAGMNSISALVDISNFLLVDSGQPFHIYDLDKIDKDHLGIRFAEKKEKFTDFKGNERLLQSDMLVMTDSGDILCVMGITGGQKAACDENTTNILVEAAYFDKAYMAKVGNFLNINTDSRFRFERGIDRSSCLQEAQRISDCIIELCGGEASKVFTIGSAVKDTPSVTLHREKLNSVAGFDVDFGGAISTLEHLGLEAEKNAGNPDVVIFKTPHWRHDLNIEEDLIEEVLRLLGYDCIPCKKLEPLSKVKNDENLQFLKGITGAKRILASRGLSEVVTYSFIKKEICEAFEELKQKRLILLNPISEDMSVMRTSLLPGLISAAVNTLNHDSKNVALMEFGNVFFDDCEQHFRIAGVRIGAAHNRSWCEPDKRKVDIFDAKGDLVALLKHYGFSENDISVSSNHEDLPHFCNPFRSGMIHLGDKVIGIFGEIHPKITKLFAIDGNNNGGSSGVVFFELKFDHLKQRQRRIKPPYCNKAYPNIERDFSFTFDGDVEVGNIVRELLKLDQNIINAGIFDCFKLSSSQKSVGFNVVIGAKDRTLTEQEASAISEKIVKCVQSFGGELRS